MSLPVHPSPPVRRRLVLLGTAFAFLVAPLVAQPFPAEEHASIELAADRTAYEPGGTAELRAYVTIDDGWHVNSHTPSYDYLIPTELTLALPSGAAASDVVYPPHSLQQFAFTDEPIAVYDGRVVLTFDVTLPAEADGAVPVEASLRYQACDHHSCVAPVTTTTSLDLVVAPGGVAAELPPLTQSGGAPSDVARPAAAGSERGLLAFLLLGVLGGLLLNAMPCVLPVLSLKLFGLVESAGHGRGPVARGALATTAGILVSFWALAAAAVLAQRAGEAVGWGMQFQQPGFVAFLAVVVVLFALNMWGLFEIPLPRFVSRAAGATSQDGAAGHFASGLLATLMATPCSAPFLGSAVGFALAQAPATVFAVFTAVGVGLALPYLALAVFPGAARFLPKPGAWMATLRGVMGFLLAAAAVWLFYVLAAQISAERVAYVQLALLALALFTWMAHRARLGSATRRIGAVAVLVAAVVSVALAVGAPPATTSREARAGLVDWIDFDESEAVRLAESGRWVFVDVTADWCLTCKANERTVIETEEIAAAFRHRDVVPMKADWTNRDDRITEFLRRFGKSAVPFYVVYRPGGETVPLPELLTKRRIRSVLEVTEELAELESPSAP